MTKCINVNLWKPMLSLAVYMNSSDNGIKHTNIEYNTSVFGHACLGQVQQLNANYIDGDRYLGFAYVSLGRHCLFILINKLI